MSLSSSAPFSAPDSISSLPLPLRNRLRIGDRKWRMDMTAPEDCKMEGVEESRLQHYLIDVLLSLGYVVGLDPT